MKDELEEAKSDAAAWSKMYGLPYAVVLLDGHYEAKDEQHIGSDFWKCDKIVVRFENGKEVEL